MTKANLAKVYILTTPEVHNTIIFKYDERDVETIKRELIDSKLVMYANWEVPDYRAYNSIRSRLEEQYLYLNYIYTFFQLDKDDAIRIISQQLLSHLFLEQDKARRLGFVLQHHENFKIEEEKKIRSDYVHVLKNQANRLKESLNKEQLSIYNNTLAAHKVDDKKMRNTIKSGRHEHLTIRQHEGIKQIQEINMHNPAIKINFIDTLISRLNAEINISKSFIKKEKRIASDNESERLELKIHLITALEQIKKQNQLQSLITIMNYCINDSLFGTAGISLPNLKPSLASSIQFHINHMLEEQLRVKRQQIEDALLYECIKKTEMSKKDWLWLIAAGVVGLFLLGSCISNSPTKSNDCYHKC